MSASAARASHVVALQAVAAKLAEAGLRPIVDAELGCVRAACPTCRAGERDPLGLYRPLEVAPKRGRVLVACRACDLEEAHRV